ncbi:MAG: RES family NAD+ phosphorylase [Owenweeksia sp.]|nr:RES family NAD+ phosphorylase [Owenweeksia sp.]
MGCGLMMVYRVTTQKRAGDLSGTGAKLYGGRWNPAGYPVIYTSQSSSLAMLETLVHADQRFLKAKYALTSLEIPDELVPFSIITKDLPPNWDKLPFSYETQEMGRIWVQDQKKLIMKVPSAVNQYESNFLINPLHGKFLKISMREAVEFHFDERFRK